MADHVFVVEKATKKEAPKPDPAKTMKENGIGYNNTKVHSTTQIWSRHYVAQDKKPSFWRWSYCPLQYEFRVDSVKAKEAKK